MVHCSYSADPVVHCLAMYNVDFDIDQYIAETNALLNSMPIFYSEEPEALEIDSFVSVDRDPEV
ncbi:hypothetical protein FRX31_013823 [Thalictrum thalictroides]|uniref:Uncharacterized protein n=1 Tax=Thalictrum thalictroides TaxID=46969 RepID=A0A7J6WIZ2_THATH|nr:hypothetical protein FRX31_013823 [Thalictrum thalictroides]